MKTVRRSPAPWTPPLGTERRMEPTSTLPTDASDPELRRVLLYVTARHTARRRRAAAALNPVATARVSRAADAPAGTLLDITRVSDDVRILRVARPAGLSFVPGQNVRVGIPGGPSNPYTIASAPHEPHLEFCIEQAPGGRVSPRLFALSPGERVTLGERAKGRFLLVPGARVHLMVATVTGISPFISMLRDASRRGTWPGRFVVLHGASLAEELAYRAELEALAAGSDGRVLYVPGVSQPANPRNRGWTGRTGRVSEWAPDVARQLTESVSQNGSRSEPAERVAGRRGHVQVYACGNHGMVSEVRSRLGAMGLPVSTETFD